MKRNMLLATCAIAVAALFSACPPPATPEPPVYVAGLFQRYVERYEPGNAAKGDPDETWLYGADGALIEDCVFEFDASFLTTGVRAYTSATVHDNTTLVARMAFQYDGSNNLIHGDIYTVAAGVDTRVGYWDATFDGAGNYLTFIEYAADGAGGWTVSEHRTSTYNADGYYLVESYFSDATTDAASLTESWTCEYAPNPGNDPLLVGRYVKETHYRKIAAAGDDTTGALPFESTIIHYFEWDADGRMYFQSDYTQDTSTPPVIERERSILYTFTPASAGTVYPVDWRAAVDTNKRAVSYFDADGVLVKLVSYRYADDGKNIEKLVENYTKPEGERAEVKETYAWSVDPADATRSFMDQRTYTYGYSTRSLKASDAPIHAPAFKRPAPAHR